MYMMRTFRNLGMVAISVAFLTTPVFAQSIAVRARLSGPVAESGRCTVEAEVDRSAEITIHGNEGVLRTLNGYPPIVRRMECTSPMPTHAADVRVRTIDGHGPVQLVATPETNGGSAVIQMGDSSSGRDVYVFDVLWSGVVNYQQFRPMPERRSDYSMNFRGRGEGFVRSGDLNGRVVDCDVTINGSDVRATFRTVNGNIASFVGRINRVDGDIVYADMTGEQSSGQMRINADGGRVLSLSMQGTGGMELNWHQ